MPSNRKQQSIESQFEANCIVQGDRYQQIEIFESILNNAIKYAPLHSKVGVSVIKKQKHKGNDVRFVQLTQIWESKTKTVNVFLHRMPIVKIIPQLERLLQV